MVAKITIPRSIKRALNYNEQKSQKAKAKCIYAHSFLKDANQLNFYEKLNRFEQLNALNPRATTNTLHVSLNFDPSEKHSNEKLATIAQTYMSKIGFGDQPYLVYVHHDAGHPHIHIVSTAIKSDGKRISLHNIGRNQSESARKEIEQEFNLIKAQQGKTKPINETTPVNVQKAQYGKAETKGSIQNVLDAVVNQYRYTSLAELNAVLRQYNVIADRGIENGHIYQKGGLLYSLLDENGKKIGIPVKASNFYHKPTLSTLERRFEENKMKRQPEKQKLKTAIDWVLSKSPADLKDLTNQLAKEKVQAILRQNKEGLIYGITFIDYRTKSVFNGSDLGKQYSIAGLNQYLRTANSLKEHTQNQAKSSSPHSSVQKKPNDLQQKDEQSHDKGNDILKDLLHPEKTFHHVPYDLLRKKKKKRNL